MRNLLAISFLVSSVSFAGVSNTTTRPDNPNVPVVNAVPATSSCESCHGAGGRNPTNSSIPKLSGQNAAYLKAQLKAYRDGSRKNDVMEAMAKPLDDAGIDSLSEYFSQQKCK